ncbi:sensor histidine kinase [Deinococcus hohokamensis]|uniref:histidine kinase n=1 Tax=Deinococcus hohokamensis TaxID=309883 RepID=A0ABV9I4C1_9DEIO
MSRLPTVARLAPPAGAAALSTLRTQFTLVIFLLAFLPNLVLTLSARTATPSPALLAWMLLVAALCGVLGYLLSGALLRPLSRLQRELESGRLREVHDDDPAEIRALRLAFTQLLERLRTEQTRRNAFMATLVHDLKTPLIATGHLTQALVNLPLPEHERREVGQQIASETGRLLALVQQMADAHRFEREDVRVQTAPTDLRVLLSGVAARLAPQADARGVALSVHGAGHASVDASVLERAVTNLADNALRYAHSAVELHVTPEGLMVLDDGPGLQADLTDLAQPFNAQPTTIAGQQYTVGTAGLGLFITRRIAEAHGGELRYERRQPLNRLSPEPAVSPTPSPSAVSSPVELQALPVPSPVTPAQPTPAAPAYTALSIVLPEVLP